MKLIQVKLGVVALLVALVWASICRAEDPSSLVGQKAKNFTLTSIEGKQVRLSTLKGKTVVLCFWSVETRTCLNVLRFSSIACETYKHKGVVFWSINVGDMPPMIRGALLEGNIKSVKDVLIDGDYKVGADYLVSEVPQTVVIGKDGAIRFVYVGMKPGFEDTLTKDLDALLSDAKESASEPEKTQNKEAEPKKTPNKDLQSEK